jgi:hypothetical protein
VRRGLRTLLVVGLAGLLGAAVGCGSSDEGSDSTTKTIAGRTITVPAVTAPTTTSPATGPTKTGTVPSTITLPRGDTVQTRELAPFRGCLRRHGVEPPPLDGSKQSGDFGPITPERVAEFRTQVRVWVSCAPFLPSPLRERLERFGERLQKRR